MAQLDRIINVSISRQTASATIQSFSDAIIVAEFLAATPTPNFDTTERVRTYGSLSEIAAAGWSAGDVVYDAAEAFFAQNPSPNQIYVGRKLTGVDGSETWTEALDAIALDNNNWYGLLLGSRTLADQQIAAAWAESNDKLCILSSDDSDILSGAGDIAEYLNTQSYDRSACLYHPESDLSADDQWADAAWFGKMFPKDPGGANWAYKSLSGIAANGSGSSYPALTTSQLNTLFGKKGNAYNRVAGIDITEKGSVGSGEWIDIIHGLDWLKARIQQLIYTHLANLDKIAYTDAGIQGVSSKLREALDEAVVVGLINAEYEVTVPLAADISSTDKSNRELTGLEWTATLQGAINTATIGGTVTY